MFQLKRFIGSSIAFAAGMASVVGWTLWQGERDEAKDAHAAITDEIEQLRRELDKDRRSQRILSAVGSSRRPSSGGTNFDGGFVPDEPSSERRDRSDVAESEVPLESVDPAEAMALADEQLETLTDAMESQPRDPGWASPMEKSLGESLDQYVARFPGGVVRDATCAESMCRMEVTYPDRVSFRRYSRSFYPPQGLSQGFVSFSDSEDEPRMVAFYAKKGERLPGT